MPEELQLLAYPLTEPLAGTVVVYHLPPEAREAWSTLLTSYQTLNDSRGNLPYAALATALRAAARTSVNLFPTSKDAPPKLLVSRKAINKDDLHDAITIFEQAILKIPQDDISFGYTSRLADLAADVTPQTISLAEAITHVGHQPDAPNWAYAAACWEAASQLAAADWDIDGHRIRHRADTDGNLLVWDPDRLWAGRWSAEAPVRYAAARIALKMKTLPYVRDPVLVVHPSVAQLANRLANARRAWLAQRDPDAPLLVLGLTGRFGQAQIDLHTQRTLTVWSKLRGEPGVLPEDTDLSGEPGRLRAGIPKSVPFPIGRGVGMHAIRELAAHVATTLGVEPVRAADVPRHRFAASPSVVSREQETRDRLTILLDQEQLPEIVTASGCTRLRIVVLYATPHTRRRIQHLLAYQFGRADLADSIPDGVETALVTDTITVIFHHDDDGLLSHGGDHSARTRLAAGIAALRPTPGVRVAALCETVYDPKSWAEQRRKARFDDSVPNPDDIDAKPIVNHVLAQQGVLAQFLAQRPPAKSTPPFPHGDPHQAMEWLRKVTKNDYRARSALADLLRAAGLVDGRLAKSLAYGPLGLTTPVAFVGLHIREQKHGGGKRRLTVCLVAIVPTATTLDAPWKVLAYCAQPHPKGGRTGWIPYTDANAAFRANPLAAGSRHTASDTGLPRDIDTALSQLIPHLHGLPYLLAVAGESSRSIWPGLANRHLDRQRDHGPLDGKIPLPGATLPPTSSPAAVIRVTHGTEDLPRPISALNTATGEVKKTTKALYRLCTTDRGNVWILSNIPKQFSGGKRFSRAGEARSRWNPTPDTDEMQHPWYAHTATELLVLGSRQPTTHTVVEPLTAAVSIARLCDQAVAWDGRTNYPAPLHLAIQIDRNHPQYRRTVDFDELEEEIDELTETEL